MTNAEYDALLTCNQKYQHENSVFAIDNAMGFPVLLKHLLAHVATKMSPRESHGTLNNR